MNWLFAGVRWKAQKIVGFAVMDCCA